MFMRVLNKLYQYHVFWGKLLKVLHCVYLKTGYLCSVVVRLGNNNWHYLRLSEIVGNIVLQ